MTDIKTLESKVNEISIEFGFREFSFPCEKYETAQRSLSRFVKSMNKKIDREELENSEDAKIKLDLISSLIKRVNTIKFAEEPQLEKMSFILENDSSSLLEYHKTKLCKYMQVRFPKELKYHYTILKNYQAFRCFYEKEEGAKEMFNKLVESNKKIFASIKELSSTEETSLESSLKLKNALSKEFPELFNTKLIETAESVCKLNKDKIEEVNKEFVANRKAKSNKGSKRPAKSSKPRKTIKMGEENSKSKVSKVAYEDSTAGANNPFASLLDNLKK
ncbi:MAG: hypothetical protein GY793_05370 [Proteobacteria bacterium]|nr:hypothetical protein [Pseudomonadota bacterium]